MGLKWNEYQKTLKFSGSDNALADKTALSKDLQTAAKVQSHTTPRRFNPIHVHYKLARIEVGHR